MAEPENPFAELAARFTPAPQVSQGNPFARFATESEARRTLAGAQPSMPEGMARMALQGLTFGFGDELLAGLQTGAGYLGDYGQAVEANRRANAAFAAYNPGTAFVSEVAGAIPTMFVPGVGVSARAVQAGRSVGTAGQYVAQGARMGAVGGALSGAGNADPGQNTSWLEAGLQRVIGGGVGGTIGAGLGAGLGALGSGGNTLSRPLRQGSDAAAMLQAGEAGNVAAQTQALRDIALELRRDAVDPAGLVRNMLPQYRNGRGGLSVDQIENVVAGHLNGESAPAIAVPSSVA